MSAHPHYLEGAENLIAPNALNILLSHNPDVFPVAAQQACQGIAARIPPGYTTTTPVSSADFQKLLQLARCIRGHGIPDWPDPNPLGEFPINARIESGGKRLFVPAVHACARLTPTPGGGIHAVRARPAR